MGDQERFGIVHHNSSSLRRYEPVEMSVLQVPLQSLTSNLPAFPPPRLQEGNITQNSPASSGKTYDIPGMLMDAVNAMAISIYLY